MLSLVVGIQFYRSVSSFCQKSCSCGPNLRNTHVDRLWVIFCTWDRGGLGEHQLIVLDPRALELSLAVEGTDSM